MSRRRRVIVFKVDGPLAGKFICHTFSSAPQPGERFETYGPDHTMHEVEVVELFTGHSPPPAIGRWIRKTRDLPPPPPPNSGPPGSESLAFKSPQSKPVHSP